MCVFQKVTFFVKRTIDAPKKVTFFVKINSRYFNALTHDANAILGVRQKSRDAREEIRS